MLRERILQAAHEGHPGIVGMKKRLRSKVWWPKMDVLVEKMVKSCKGCILVSAPENPELLKRREMPEKPWVDIAIDFLGPLPSSEYILVAIDYFSRYKEIKIMRNINSTNTILKLREIFTRLGYPQTITCDNGPQFRSEELKNFCNINNIKLYHTIPYWPQQNGEVERQNREILKRIKISSSLKRNWKEDIQDYIIMYHNTPHSVTGKAPAELFFGRLLKDKLPEINQHSITHEETRDQDKLQKAKGKIYTDKRRNARENTLSEGDTVLVKANRENKLSSNFQDVPHTVLKKSKGDILIKNDETGDVTRRNIVHLKKVDGSWSILK